MNFIETCSEMNTLHSSSWTDKILSQTQHWQAIKILQKFSYPTIHTVEGIHTTPLHFTSPQLAH